MTAPVLIVDDDEDIREALQILLESEGFAVVVAADGEEALERMRAGLRPALVLLDLMMPTMPGGEVAEALRRDERTMAIPIVVVTGDVNGCEVARNLRVDGCLRKPIELEDLLGVVRRFEQRQTGAPSGP